MKPFVPKRDAHATGGCRELLKQRMLQCVKKNGFLATLLAVSVALVLAPPPVPATSLTGGSLLPEFTHSNPQDWLNSPPLTVSGLRGSVVLVDFWAFECWNCYQTIPWLNDIQTRYGKKGLVVVSVHTPELEVERVRDNVIEAVQRYHVRNPVMLDNDYSYWDAFGNEAWPTLYLSDRSGKLRLAAAGEVHIGDENARRIDAAIERLLAVKPAGR